MLAYIISWGIGRPDGARQTFAFMPHDDYLQSVTDIPEPHAFAARLRLGHGDHTHDFDVEFHEHEHPETVGLVLGTQEFADAHERAHVEDIRRRFANGVMRPNWITLVAGAVRRPEYANFECGVVQLADL